MRSIAIAAGSAAVLAVAALGIVWSGAHVASVPVAVRPEPAVSPEAAAFPGPAPKTVAPAGQQQKTSAAPAAVDHEALSAHARAVGSDVVTPPEASGELQRVEARGALSEIGQALPPKPKMPADWDGTTLFRPVATAAGRIEAKGFTVALAGIEAIEPGETCASDGTTWPCGMRARSAFRGLLRGRAVTCVLPPEPDRAAIVAPCQLGTLDLAAWLVGNGWARATAQGPYAALGEAAEKARRGIFGAAPSASAPAQSVSDSSLPAPGAVSESLLGSPSVTVVDPQAPDAPDLVTPQVFPPAPPQ